jgi:hypothetical protein
MRKTTIIFFALNFIFAVDYETQIQPIFDNNCGGCHLANSQGGLNLSNYDNLMSSGTIVAGSAIQSILYDRITRAESDQGNMPPIGALSEVDIDLIAQWINDGALPEESSDISGCTDSDAITCDDDIDPLYFPECDTCSDDDPCDNYYNPDATIDNGLCMYDAHPTYEEFTIENFNNGSLYLDWSMFMPPVDVSQYVLMRCADIDGDNNGDGEFEYEMCVMIIPPMPLYTNMNFTDDFSDATDYGLDDIVGIKYTLSIGYPNNNYWGSAFGNYYYESSDNECVDGDINNDNVCMPMECFDGIWYEIVIDCAEEMGVPCENGFYIDPPEDVCCSTCVLSGDLNFDNIINVIDVVSLVNGILTGNLTSDQMLVADLNGDQTINVIDIVSLVNMILG